MYKTKEIPSTMKSIFKNPEALKEKVDAIRKLLEAKIDFRVLNSIKIGFLQHQNNKKKNKQAKSVPLPEFKKFLIHL